MVQCERHENRSEHGSGCIGSLKDACGATSLWAAIVDCGLSRMRRSRNFLHFSTRKVAGKHVTEISDTPKIPGRSGDRSKLRRLRSLARHFRAGETRP